MKIHHNIFLFKKVYLPLLIITCSSILIIYLLKTPASHVATSIHISFVKNTEEIIMLIKESKVFQTIVFIVITLVLLKFYRKRTSDNLFNNGDVYLDISHFHFYLAKVLGYKKISLVRIPIALQYKIIIKDIFKKNIAETHERKVKKVKVNIVNENFEEAEVNLILSDTYKVEYNQLPANKANLTMVSIDSKADKVGIRIYNPLFVEEIQHQMFRLSGKYKRINIFSHTNTHHNKEIIESCFKMGGRSQFQEVYVYQFDTKEAKFYVTPKKVI